MLVRIYDVNTSEILLVFPVEFVGEVESRNLFYALVKESVSDFITTNRSGMVYFSKEKYAYDIVKDGVVV